jgi:hypothetical protein
MLGDIHTPESRLSVQTSTLLSQHAYTDPISTGTHELHAHEIHGEGSEQVSFPRTPRSVPTRMRMITEDARNHDSDSGQSPQIKFQRTRGVCDSDTDTGLSSGDTARRSTNRTTTSQSNNSSENIRTQILTPRVEDGKASPSLRQALLAREAYMQQQALIPRDPSMRQAMWFSKVLKHEPEMPKGGVNEFTGLRPGVYYVCVCVCKCSNTSRECPKGG